MLQKRMLQKKEKMNNNRINNKINRMTKIKMTIFFLSYRFRHLLEKTKFRMKITKTMQMKKFKMILMILKNLIIMIYPMIMIHPRNMIIMI